MWVKTCEGEYINLSAFERFCVYSLETKDEDMVAAKLTAKDEGGAEEVISHFLDFEEAEQFIIKATFGQSSVLVTDTLEDVLRSHSKEYPSWGEGETYESFQTRKEEFITSLDLQEIESVFD